MSIEHQTKVLTMVLYLIAFPIYLSAKVLRNSPRNIDFVVLRLELYGMANTILL